MKKTIIITIVLIAVFCATTYAQTMGTMTDPRDGQIYKTVNFENMLTGTSITWMAENLNFKTSDSYVYENNEKFRDDLGLLYTMEDANKACPKGWHLPSDGEWKILVNEYDGDGKAGEALKSEKGWNDSGNGTNVSGFNGLPAGCHGPGGFGYLGKSGYWWSSTAFSEGEAWRYGLGGSISGVARIYYYKHYAYSCRCVRD